MESSRHHRPSHATDAASPWKMTRADWIQVVKRAWTKIGTNNVGLIAAGVAFYCFTAIMPALASIVLTYGLLAEAETVSRHINELFRILPKEAATLIAEQLVSVVKTSSGEQGLGLVVALGIAFYGVSKATSSMIIALNVAYDEKETRGLIWLTVLSFMLVVGGVALVLTAFATTAALAFLGSLIPEAPSLVLAGIRAVSYLVLAALVVTATACLYRYAPSRPHAKWMWLSPGALVATVVWLAATAGFGFYASRFGDYNATYGSLSAVVVLLTWLWLSSYVFLIGAELNGELERQTSAKVVEDPNQTLATDADIQTEKQNGFAEVASDKVQHARGTATPPTRQSVARRSRYREEVGAHRSWGSRDLLKAGAGAGAVVIAGVTAIGLAMQIKR
jgi:membrane protein